MWHVLGPVEVIVQGRALDIGRPQVRAVLAFLLLNSGMVVRVDDLATALWEDAAPAGASRQVRVRVAQLRAALRSAGLTEALCSVVGGYRLSVDAEEYDASVFARHVEQARSALAAGDAATAAEQLRCGLDLWRGPPLAGAAGAFVDVAAARLQEQRLAAYEQLAQADLALGRHDVLVGVLRPIVDAHPLRERLVGQLMVALAGSGRQAEALELYGQTRARLCDELGVTPAAELASVHLQVLRQQIPASSTPSLPRPAIKPAPAQLPADVAGFTGRVAHLAELDALLPRDGARHGRRRSCVITARPASARPPSPCTGRTGCAALPRRPALRRPARLRPGRRRRSTRPRRCAASSTRSACRPRRCRPTSTQQAALYRTLLAGRRMLVVLDNARDADQVRPLLPGTPGCLVVVTSRNQLTGLVAARAPTRSRSTCSPRRRPRSLLARRLGARPRRPPNPPRSTRSSPGAPGCRWPWRSWPPAPRLTPASAAAPLAAELRDAGAAPGRVDAGDDPATDLRAVFSWSYRQLERRRGAAVPAARPAPRPGHRAAGRGQPRRPTRRHGARRCWPSWPAPTWSPSTRPAGTPCTTCCAPTPPSWPQRRRPRTSAGTPRHRPARPLPAHRRVDRPRDAPPSGRSRRSASTDAIRCRPGRCEYARECDVVVGDRAPRV